MEKDKLCLRKLYDQDDGEVAYCQLPYGHSHKQKHTPWPELKIQKPEQHFPIIGARGE